MHPLLFFHPGESLSLAELCAAQLDGHVVPMGEGFVPADAIDRPELRAQSLRPLASSREDLAFIGPSAAWILGAGHTAPRIHHLQRTGERRSHRASSTWIVHHEFRLPSEDTTRSGGCLLSSPARTTADLARGSVRRPAWQGWLCLLLAVFPELEQDALAWLDQHPRHPHRVPARRALRDASAQARHARALTDTVAARRTLSTDQDDVTR